MRVIIGIMMLVLLLGCKNFELEKTTSEELLDEELKAMNWNTVDTYPTFESCHEFSEKEKLKSCFQETIASYIYGRLQEDQMLSSSSLQDTLLLELKISKTGEPTLTSFNGSAKLSNIFPELEHRLKNVVDSLPQIYPAYKRGIPVTTSFKLPVVFMTNK